MISNSVDKSKISQTAINNLLFNQNNNEEYSFQYYNTLGQNLANLKEQNKQIKHDQNQNKKKQLDDVESVLEIVDEAYKDIHQLIDTVDNPRPQKI